MRVLFASLASAGHAFPLVPLAVAAQAAGHEVRFAVGEEVHAALKRHGLAAFRPADAFYEIYADDIADDLARLRPDLVVHGWGVPGVAVAADRAGIPSLWHGFGRLFPDGIGLARPGCDRPHVDVCPPSLQDPAFIRTAERVPMRPVEAHAEAGAPIVYLTFGTAFGSAELIRTAAEGLAGLGLPVVVAAGRVPVDELDDLPSLVTVLPWAAQDRLLARADLVVHHGGSGTTLGALAAGVPQLVLPQGADQFANADALVTAGAALQLRDGEVTAGAVAELAHRLRTGEHRAAARELAAEIARMPAPEDVARDLVRYVRA
ncbi:glycosyltransferase [Dactylosporangium sp. AC04546]|uniref:glycosyltransferase n=1 Tax=Dactylosporangium sp. AC04546 TaxID=2862460 RepID=UPI0027152207|nr:glycosyltransferase [Dactylosporangium sp. AC04546]WVK88498.1 glycosyltransferase [Dactylosporangium sp. AC04546]